MRNTTSAQFISLTGLLLATGVIFPFIFHQFGIAGRIFLPMHIPVFMAGLILGPWSGLLVGALSPGLSAMMTGMPPAALAIPMTPELAAYGLVSGLLFRGTRTSLYISLLGAMIVGRIIWVPMAILIAPLLLPLMTAIGISPIQFAAIMGVNTAMGGVTPPYASILYLGARIGNVKFSEVVGPAMMLIIFGYLPVVVLTSFWSDLSLFLPTVFGY